MRRSTSIAIIALLSCAVLSVLWSRARRQVAAVRMLTAGSTPQPTAAPSPPQSPSILGIAFGSQIDVVSLSREEVEIEVRRREAQDSKWEWKIPIRFYGRVIDENQRPVANASVHFQWTNLSSKGTSNADATSDEAGLFSLANVQGKRLLVRVAKAGYYSSDSRNRLSYEFANPFEETYYQPSTNRPAVFYLRKEGIDANLTVRSTEVVLPGDGSSTRINLQNGKTGSNGQLQIQAWKPWPPRPMSPSYDWKVTFTLQGGGFVEAVDEFAFEAPESGYSDPYVIDMLATLGSGWKVSVEKTLYFAYGEPKKYGRLTFRTDGNSRYVFLNYVINPSGSRNLESADSLR